MPETARPPDPATDEHRGDPSVAVWAALRRRPLRFLVSWWPWRCWAFLLSGTLLGFALLLTLAALLFLGLGLSVLGIGVLLLATAAVIGVPVGAVERRRLRWVDPTPLPDPHGSLSGVSAAAWFRTRLRERATWRELGYAVSLATVVTAVGVGFVALLGLSVLLTVVPVIVWAIAPDTVMLVPGEPISDPVQALPGSVAGLLGLTVCAYAGGLLVGAQVRAAWFLLSARDEDLRSRVIELTRSRARLVDAFEAERRRIERDLHDGAQQQLVALTMTLGLAELELRGHDSPTAELISRARGEARLALDQLRDLVRGIHPQVLTDHGLTAAVAEVALRNPIPVTVDIELPHRLPTAVESMAYFSVTEALTNASKHSGASRISVVGRVDGDRFTLLITDDGRGGADPVAGAGLRGLADRLAIQRGRLIVSSPMGGPTQLRVEVPCSA
ncbi:sensor histidine kinase [Streptomyces cyaneus]|uniref:sensor histidine kinase n=1 Tax=Streptomyces cyaneus TaxID=1904 RepID=UPI000FF8AA1D|nr:sensor histidine kinase [Streptomyces cyaneus]